MVAIIGEGAEAILYKDDAIVVKQRREKGYRLPALDAQLRKSRTRHEVKILTALAEKGLPVPKLISSDENSMEVHMEYIEGDKLRDVLHKDPLRYGKEMGELVAGMHHVGVIHQDLTTSNMIVRDSSIVLIDFGLSFFSDKLEDKAVDLHLLERALSAKHSDIYDSVWGAVVSGYASISSDHEAVMERFAEVKQRGRNRH